MIFISKKAIWSLHLSFFSLQLQSLSLRNFGMLNTMLMVKKAFFRYLDLLEAKISRPYATGRVNTPAVCIFGLTPSTF